MNKSILTMLILFMGASFLSATAFAENKENEERLLALHKAGIEAHKNKGLEAWLEGFKDGFVSANRGGNFLPYPRRNKKQISSLYHICDL